MPPSGLDICVSQSWQRLSLLGVGFDEGIHKFLQVLLTEFPKVPQFYGFQLWVSILTQPPAQSIGVYSQYLRGFLNT
jgi:hypothetical protein